MKIIGINQKNSKNQNAVKSLELIDEATHYSPDVIFAPDYFLDFKPLGELATLNEKIEIRKQLEKISRRSPNTLIIPGTMPYALDSNYMIHSAMAFKNGRMIKEFIKETSVGEENLAESNRLKYFNGDYSKNSIVHDGKKIAVEICSDHGKQPIEKDTFVELIIACDPAAGFYIRPNNNRISRYAIISDAYSPRVEGFFYNATNEMIEEIIPKRVKNKSIYLFDLYERNILG